MKKLVFVVYEMLTSYPNINWAEAYLMLFERAIKDGEKELARQTWYQIIAEAIRTKDKWIIAESIEPNYTNNEINKNYYALKDLNLYDFSKKLLKVIPEKKSKRHYPPDFWESRRKFRKDELRVQFRLSNYNLCACCHKYVLTCDEIQNFPIENNETYIRRTFEKALTQKEPHKKKFLLERLVSEYSDKKLDINLLLELWVKAEDEGVHFEPLVCGELIIQELMKKENFKRLHRIINYRHREHDSFIDDYTDLLLKQGRYDFAYYFNAKLSTGHKRLWSALTTVLTNEVDEVKNIQFIKKVYESTKHEKVKND